MWCLYFVSCSFADIGLDYNFYVIMCNENEKQGKDGMNKTRGT